MTRLLRHARRLRDLLFVALAVAWVLVGGPGGSVTPPVGPSAAWADDAGSDAAATAARTRCRGQCMAYHLLWCPDSYGSTCWSLFERYCAKDAADAVETMVGFAVNCAAGELADLDALAELAGCLTVMKTCLDDFRRGCAGECDYNPLAYAPNPSVYWNSESQAGNSVVYDAAAHVLRVTVKNKGYSLCRNVGYTVSIGSTRNQDRKVTGTVVESGTIPLLSPACTLRSGGSIPPKEFTLTIPWEPVADAYNEVLVSVDGSQLIEETNEYDNIFRFKIDNLPSPCQVKIEGVRIVRTPGVLDRVTLVPTLHNTGEADCDVTVALYAGDVAAGEAPLAQRAESFSPGETEEAEFPVTLNTPGGTPSGSRHARFTVRVHDANGRIHDEQVVDVPLLAGRISGRVTGRLGRPVAGATVAATASAETLATTQSGSSGFYHLEGIARLGDVTVTGSHPDYSATASRTVTLTYDTGADDPWDTGSEAGLSIQGVDLVLSDTPGTLVIVVMDAATRQPLGGASWSAVSPPTVRSGVMAAGESTTTLDGLPPGEWLVTASKARYETATERTVLVTGQTATVVLWLEPFAPREDDDGLELFPPESLWKKTYDGWCYAHASSKDGRLLVLYTANPGVEGSGKLHFLEPIQGTEIATVSLASAKGQQQVSLDVAYRGDPVGLFLHEGIPGRPGPGSLVLYDAKGHERTRLVPPPRQHPYVEVSPDGAWVYAWGLFDGTLREVPDHRPLDPKGYPRGWPQEKFLVDEAIHFTRDGRFIGMCPRDAGAKVCRLTLHEEVVVGYPGVKPVLRIVDSGGPAGVGEADGGGTGGAQGSEVLLFTTDAGVHRYVGTTSTWTRTPEDFGLPHGLDLESASLSPGGDVVMLVQGQRHGRLHVYSWRPRPPGLPSTTEDDREVTPPGLPPWAQHVSANEKGLFFLMVKGHEYEYFRMGRYGSRPRRPPSGP